MLIRKASYFRKKTQKCLDLCWQTIEAARGYRLFRYWYGGAGTILMFHRVRNKKDLSLIDGTRKWEITPEYLEELITHFKQAGFEFISLDQLLDRLKQKSNVRRFICLTFDDGYSDIWTLAYPILKKHAVPFGLYVTTSFPDKTSKMTGEPIEWGHLEKLSTDPLVTIGAHTVNHVPLSSLSEKEALWEMSESKRRLEARLKISVRHFAYPYGHEASTGHREFRLAKSAGFDTAVTTLWGNVFREHESHLHALPRINVDGTRPFLQEVEKSMCGYLQARARQLHRLHPYLTIAGY